MMSPSEEEELDLTDAGPSFLRRLMVRFLALCVLVGLFVVFAPNIVSGLGLSGLIYQQFAGRSGGRLSVGQAQFAWWSPINIQHLRWQSSDGSLQVVVTEFSTENRLFDLVTNPADLGHVIVREPIIKAQWVPEASEEPADPEPNLDALVQEAAPWVANYRGSLALENGTLEVTDSAGKTVSLTEVTGNLSLPKSGESDLHIDLAGSVKEAGNAPLKTEIDASWVNAQQLRSLTGWFEAQTLPLEFLNPLIHWLGDPSELAGSLTGRADFQFDHAAQAVTISTKSQIDSFEWRSPWIEPDVLRLATASAHASGKLTRQSLELTRADLNCPMGRLNGEGNLSWGDSAAPNQRTFTLAGTVDLPKLSKALPNTVHIRPDVELTAGELAIRIQPTPESDRLQASLQIDGLVARCAGEPVEWPKPVSVAGSLGTTDRGLVSVSDFQFESDFLRAKGEGTLEEFDVTAVCDLNRLKERTGRLIDWGDSHVAGKFSGRVQSKRTDDGRISIRGAAKAEAVAIRYAGETVLAEPELQGQFQATLADASSAQIQSAAVVVKNNTEQLNVHLREPVADWTQGPWGTWDLQASGDLAEIARRLKPWTTMFEGKTLAGLGVISGRFIVENDVTTFQDFVVDVQQFVYATPDLRINEPRLRLTTAGQLRPDDLAIDLGPTLLVSDSVQFRTEQLRSKMTDFGIALSCHADLVADLAKVRAWSQPAQPADLFGQYQGAMKIDSNGERWITVVDGAIQNARYMVGADPVIDEPKVTLNGQVSAAFTDETAAVNNLRIAIPGLGITATGEIVELMGRQDVKLDGWIDYDLQTLSPRLRTILGEHIQLAGSDRQRFKLQGPLQSGAPATEFAAATTPVPVATERFPELTGEVSLHWDRANFYGFAAGPAVINAKLEKSWIITQPVTFPLNGGTVELRPGFFLGAKANYLHHPAGAIARNVKLTREMCDGALQYIAPVLAKSVDVQGDISLEVSEIQVPLGYFDQAQFSGKLLLNDVKASGSPLIEEIIVLTEGKSVIEVANNTEVPFRIAGGRVYHENLKLRLPGINITTSGSVGLDRTLEMVIETPVPKKWVKDPKVAEIVGTSTIRIPVGGTLDKPKLDRTAMQREIAQLATKGAGRAVEAEINKQIDKQLDRLFEKIR